MMVEKTCRHQQKQVIQLTNTMNDSDRYHVAIDLIFWKGHNVTSEIFLTKTLTEI